METIEYFSNKLEQFLEEIPITIHRQGNSVIVGVKQGYVRRADKIFGRRLVLDILSELEDNHNKYDL